MRIFGLFALISIAVMFGSACQSLAVPQWKDVRLRKALQNDALRIELQAGFPMRMVDRRQRRLVLDATIDDIPNPLAVFGSGTLDLNACEVLQKANREQIETIYISPDGTRWGLLWRIEPGDGDLILQVSAQTPQPVDQLRMYIPGCDITTHTLVWIDGYGVGHTANAPWSDIFLGDPRADSAPMKFPHPVVALFQGKDVGWFIEGRNEMIGPANMLIKGNGDTVALGLNRRFTTPTAQPQLFEIRIRAYRDHWEDAVDPYTQWLNNDAGYLAIDELPEQQAWVDSLKSQAYITVGDYAGIDALAERLNPEETFIGRQAEFRYHGFDIGYPDYRLTEGAKEWTQYVRDKGFHVGMHFNSQSFSAVMFPELVERFRPALNVIGKDEVGNDIYESIYSGPTTVYRVSSGYKPWRDHLIEQIADAVDAGVDVIYLDESMSPGGKFVVDGVNGYEGVQLLMKEILERYPHVAIQTEQFNTLTAKYGKIALSQMPLGHPLAGYIFQRFVRVVPEGVMYSPTDEPMMDAFDNWGFMIPGADTTREESWMRIAEAFQKYDLIPDSRLPREHIGEYVHHYSSGEAPVIAPITTPEGIKLFGYQGHDGITAHFEIHPNKRGLVVYEPDEEPKWIGTRYRGIRSYDGPGLPMYYTFRERMNDWLIYDDQQLLGLDPNQTYWFNAEVQRSFDRFHLTKVPDDFRGITDNEMRAWTQEVGTDDTFFRITFAGHGEVEAHVPAEYDAYLNGRKLDIDPQTYRATATVNAGESNSDGLGYHIELQTKSVTAGDAVAAGEPATILAFRRTDTPLVGRWIDWQLFGSQDALKWIKPNDSEGFTMSVGTRGRFVGWIPAGEKVLLRGEYRMTHPGTGQPGDGVVWLNGVEVLRVPHGDYPYDAVPFDTDITAFAGQYVLFEFGADHSVRGGEADWIQPQVVVEETAR